MSPAFANAAVLLGVAIAAEVVGTSALKASDGFTRLWPSLLTVLGYGCAFYCLALTMRVLPVGIIYAVWSGAGIVLVSLAGWIVFGDRLDLPGFLGIGLIVAGVLVIQLLSSSVRT